MGRNGNFRRPPKLYVVDVNDDEELPQVQVSFIDNYVADPTNSAAAARKAGVPDKDAAGQAMKWLNTPRIAGRIAYELNKRAERTQITKDRVLQELAILGFSSIDNYEEDEHGNLVVREGVPEYAIRAVSSVKYKTVTDKWTGDKIRTFEFKLHPKVETMRLIMTHLAMLVQRLSIIDPRNEGLHADLAAMDMEQLKEEAKRALRLMSA